MRNTNKSHLATISILVKDRHTQSPDINQLLTEQGNLIMARLGVNLQPKCMEQCTAMITLACHGTKKDIRTFTKKLDEIYGIVAKETFLN